MPGSFSKQNRPVRPGAYFDWEAQPTTTIAPNIGSVVCLAIVHDWGPANILTPCMSLADFQTIFGPSTDTPGYIAAMQCFRGEGVSGRGGAGEVLAYRMVGSGAAESSVELPDASEATSLTLTALYPGSYGDNLAAVVSVGIPATNTQVAITLNGMTIESFSWLASDVEGLAELINTTSKWVSAEAEDAAEALDTSSTVPIPFAGGDDGIDTLANSDWTGTPTSMLDQVSAARFSLFAAFDVTDTATLTAIAKWQSTLNSGGKRFMTVVGGGATDTAATAVARSAQMADMQPGGLGGGENVVNLGVGTLVDDQLGELTTSQLAPRIAGILAARGETMSLTFARMAGCTPGSVMPSDADVSLCFDGGVVCFGVDSNAASPVRVEKGLTTYIGGDDSKPYLIYRNPKFVRTMHGIELDITDWATGAAIGSLQVNDQTRALVVGYGHQVMEQRAGLGVIQDGYTVGVDPIPAPSDDDEFVAVVYGIAFGRSVEQIYNTVYIS